MLMGSTAPASAAAGGTPIAAAPAAQTEGGIFQGAINEFNKIKSWVTHFFTSTKVGQTIEHVGLEIEALPGFHAFLVKYEAVAMGIVKDLLSSAAATPGSKTIEGVLSEAATDVKSAAGDALNEVSAGWEHAAVSIALQNVSALPGSAALLAKLIPGAATTPAPAPATQSATAGA
jgi:hypothetical protein